MELQADIQIMEEILEAIFQRYGYDFRDYAKASLLRRMEKFIHDHKLESIATLRDHLLTNETSFHRFLQEITVNVTELFRDPQYYRFLRQQIIPMLGSYPLIKIWHAGCSTGEEVFSMCILLHEAGLLNRTRIYATDINPVNLEKAKSGIVSLRYMRDYIANYQQSGGIEDFADYYTAKYDHAILHESLRQNIVFSQHNLVSDHPFNEFQFISCRNVMIYFNRTLQDRVLQLFYESLSSLGYLGIGLKETIAFSTVRDQFDAVSAPFKIYRRRD